MKKYIFQGGYLQGRLKLPKNAGNLRVVFSTISDKPLHLDPEVIAKSPGVEYVHPTILFVVRKSRGNK